MKKFFTIVLFLAIGMFAFAQQGYQDAVYLKNGSIIRGIIIEQVPNVSLKIETADKSVMVYKMEEIEKMTKETVVKEHASPGMKFGSGNNSGIKPGYFGMTNFGYGFGLNDTSKGLNTLDFETINGFQAFPYFSFGIGTGVKFWMMKDEDTKPLLVPAFVDLRGHFLKGPISPFIGIDLGYCWMVSPDAKGLGFLFKPSVGVSFVLGGMSRVNIGTGYYMQRYSDTIGYTVSTWNFNFGISF